ncbi:S8 family peptidase [Spirosoma koreense]
MRSLGPTPDSELPFVPEDMARPCCADKENLREIFPKPFVIENSLFKIPDEYIIMSQVGESLDFLEVEKEYILTSDGHIFNVTVERNNSFGEQGRTFVLLKGVNGSDLRGMATFDQLDVFSSDSNETIVLNNEQIGVNRLGQIHPGPTGGSGSSEGYPNAYGISRPVVPVDTSSTDEHTDYKREKPVERPAYYDYCSISVAVLDSGLLANTIKYRQDNEERSNGWNFVADNANTHDDHPEAHGTRISLIINYICPSAEILPVKIAQASGACELYDVLCGLEYARVQKAQIINASFSFKIAPDRTIPLLKTMINALKKENIWVIAAAGNAIQYPKDALGNTPPLGENAPLNLPACYSRNKSKNRIVTVTTVSCTRKLKQVDGHSEVKVTKLKLGECYSKKFVDVGAVANGFKKQPFVIDDHSFQAPDFEARPGTSYATAYVTGIVATILLRNIGYDKKQLMRKLTMKKHHKLQEGIRDGNCIKV